MMINLVNLAFGAKIQNSKLVNCRKVNLAITNVQNDESKLVNF